jgi:hypothetical protein
MDPGFVVLKEDCCPLWSRVRFSNLESSLPFGSRVYHFGIEFIILESRLPFLGGVCHFAGFVVLQDDSPLPFTILELDVPFWSPVCHLGM